MPSRPGQLNLATVLATQNPTIDLHLSAYEASARNFSQAFADFNARAIAEITQRREAHVAETKKIAERAQNMEKETNQCKLKEIELIGGQCLDARTHARARASFVPHSLFVLAKCRVLLCSTRARARGNQGGGVLCRCAPAPGLVTTRGNCGSRRRDRAVPRARGEPP